MATKRPVANDEPRYYARRGPFGYGQYDQLDRGQVIQLEGLGNDEKLLRLGYLEACPAKLETFTCAECGAEFISEPARRGHGDKRHRTDPYAYFDAAGQVRNAKPTRRGQYDTAGGVNQFEAEAVRGEVLAKAALEEAELNDVAPIYWEKTAASQKG